MLRNGQMSACLRQLVFLQGPSLFLSWTECLAGKQSEDRDDSSQPSLPLNAPMRLWPTRRKYKCQTPLQEPITKAAATHTLPFPSGILECRCDGWSCGALFVPWSGFGNGGCVLWIHQDRREDTRPLRPVQCRQSWQICLQALWKREKYTFFLFKPLLCWVLVTYH